MVTEKNRCAFWTEKLRQRKIYIYHMGFTFYIAVELSPWLFFLSCKITIFSVGVTTCNSDFSETPPKIKHIENRTNTPYICLVLVCWGFFSHTPVSFYLGFYITLTSGVFQDISLTADLNKGSRRQPYPIRQHGSCLHLFIMLNMVTTPLLRLHWIRKILSLPIVNKQAIWCKNIEL